ncbi:MAG: SCO family protein [Magnetococcus sp. DMHC-6]
MKGQKTVSITSLMWILIVIFSNLNAMAQTLERELPVGRQPVFDSEQAVAVSQAAIGRILDSYELTDRKGQLVDLASFRGKPLIISLVYTSCYHTCSLSTRFLASVIDKARTTFGEGSFQVVTIGFDVLHDTPKAMDLFARQQRVDKQPNWLFLSGSDATMIRLVRNLGFRYSSSPKGFDHLVQATVVDANGVIYRQVYGESFPIPLLMEPLRELILGTPPAEETPISELLRRVRFFCTTYDPSQDAYRVDYSLFVGMFIGGSIIFGTFILLLREFRRQQKSGKS